MSKRREHGIRIISMGGNSNCLALRHARLQLEGYEVWSTTNPLLALKFIKHERCGILLLHYSLPEYWVKTLIKNFRRSCPNGRVIGIAQRAGRPLADVDQVVLESEGTAPLLKAISGEVEGDTAA